MNEFDDVDVDVDLVDLPELDYDNDVSEFEEVAYNE